MVKTVQFFFLYKYWTDSVGDTISSPGGKPAALTASYAKLVASANSLALWLPSNSPLSSLRGHLASSLLKNNKKEQRGVTGKK